MIQIDMPMPKNCIDCPACNEYLMCAIPVSGRGWGENDVKDFSQSRPEWCPMKEQPQIVRCGECKHKYYELPDGRIVCTHIDKEGNDEHGADWFCADGDRK